jgi:VWFA-related protein
MKSTKYIAAVVVAGITLVAQETSSKDDTTPIFRTSINEVIVPATVTDKDGSYVPGLKSSDFRVYDNDRLQEEIRVSETEIPVSLVVAIQADFKVETIIPKVQRLGTLLLDHVAGSGGEIAILAFDHRMQHLTDGFTSDPDKVQAAMKKLHQGSSTAAIIDAVEESTRMLSHRPKDRRRIILLISESRDRGSSAKLRETLSRTEFENITIFSLSISRLYTETMRNPQVPRPDPIPAGARHSPAGGDLTPTTAAQLTGTQGYGANFVPLFVEIFKDVKGIFVADAVDVFTKFSGGREAGFISDKSLQRAADDIGREIHNQYIITYTPDKETQLAGGFHNIRVDLGQKGLQVRTRPGYWLAAVNGK